MYEHDNGYIKIFMHKLNKNGGDGGGIVKVLVKTDIRMLHTFV